MGLLELIVPESNRLELCFSNGHGGKAEAMAAAYAGGFVGTFIDAEDQPAWARRAARYLADEFDHDTPGRLKRFSDIEAGLPRGDGGTFANFKHALEAWEAGGKVGPEPFSVAQNYGSCVDASCAEHEDCLFGWRAAHPQALAERGETPEAWKHAAAWYKYAERGYCSDGWNGSGIATVARRIGAAFRIKYELDGNSVDFTDEDENERICARSWCRRGVPAWLKEHTVANHAYADGAITRFDGGPAELLKVFAAGGVVHTSATRTSGGSRPYTLGRTGPHMQSAIGADASDEFRKFSRDVIGEALAEDDFGVILNQTWGGSWSGACAERYWPAWWGKRPEGAWVWKASQVLRYLSCDYAWLPWVRGFPSDGPAPPVPPAEWPVELAGELHVERISQGRDAIRGVLSANLAGDSRPYQFLAVPAAGHVGTYKLVPWDGV